MTTLDLDAIKARAEAATPGPWRFLDDPSNTVVADQPERGRSVGAFSGGPFTIGGTYNYDDPQNDANASFIAAARSDIPALVAEVEALRAQNTEAAARGYANGYDDGLDDQLPDLTAALAERDALTARIEAALALCDAAGVRYDEDGRYIITMSAEKVRAALSPQEGT